LTFSPRQKTKGVGVLSTHRQFERNADFAKAAVHAAVADSARARPLYSPAERQRRDESVWTLVQGILAPVQFLIFLISLGLVLRFLATGAGESAADASIVVKTLALYTIMITGSIWEKQVFGEWLFARAFFWEDVFSMAVLALHSAYLLMLLNNWGTPQERIYVALAGYAAYVINAGQFLYKLRLARLQTAGAAA
jgi:3-vinyl bacteriochlorophyllide hydratase